MANESNLIPYTADQDRTAARENGRKGGKASGAARRKKKNMVEIASMMLEQQLTDTAKQSIKRSGICTDDIAPDDMTALTYMVAGQIRAAANGNTKAFEMLVSLADREKKRKLELQEMREEIKRQKLALERQRLEIDRLKGYGDSNGENGVDNLIAALQDQVEETMQKVGDAIETEDDIQVQ